MKHRPMDFEELDQLFSYDAESGDTRNKIDRGTRARAGTIATRKMNTGYLQIQFTKNGRKVGYLAHRAAWLLYYGIDPGANEIDHIDGNRSNNKIENLRLVDNQGNMENKRKYKNNTSEVTGVYWHKGNGKWAVQISDRGKQQTIGRFEDKFEAICCRKSAEKRLGYHENHGK